MYYDDELPAGFQDADFEMRELEEESNRLHALQQRGYCTHSRWVGLPDSGEIYYPEQVGLVGDQVRCTGGCGQVFANDEEIHYAEPTLIGRPA